MKYWKAEKAVRKCEAEKKALDDLAKMYCAADSMSEFGIKASAAGLENSKHMKWLKLLYFLKNNSIHFSWFSWFVTMTTAAAATVALAAGVELAERMGAHPDACAASFLGGMLCLVFGEIMLHCFISGRVKAAADAVWRYDHP